MRSEGRFTKARFIDGDTLRRVFRSFMRTQCPYPSDGPVGPCKTEISQHRRLWTTSSSRGGAWHPVCGYPKPDDWIFASDYNFRQDSLWPDSLRSKVLQPTARRVGIVKQMGWHTFRRTYSSLLAATGDDVKVVHRKPKHSSTEQGMRVGPRKTLLLLKYRLSC